MKESQVIAVSLRSGRSQPDHPAPQISTESHLGLLQPLQPREVGDQDGGPVGGGHQDGGGEEVVPEIEVAVPGVSLAPSSHLWAATVWLAALQALQHCNH